MIPGVAGPSPALTLKRLFDKVRIGSNTSCRVAARAV
jgi:hypothetical protein